MNKLFICCCVCLFSCSLQRNIHREAAVLYQDSLLRSGFTGISIYDADQQKFIYRYNAAKYFIPASNMKLFTAYAALNYLSDSIPGVNISESEDKLYISPTGDPTLLHRDFKTQKVFDFLTSSVKPIYAILTANFMNRWGNGWSWDDYSSAFMAERSQMPVYGNVIDIRNDTIDITSANFINRKISASQQDSFYTATRPFDNNVFIFYPSLQPKNKTSIPFITSEKLSYSLLSDTLHKDINITNTLPNRYTSRNYTIYSQHRDSVLAYMMHNSDNLFAEQLMYMMNRKLIGTMKDDILDTINNRLFSELPQPLRWKDASGLSRYNQVSPDDCIEVLKMIKEKAGMPWIQSVFPTGNEGTLKNYYVDIDKSIYAKTGSMSNVYCLSGYLYTRKNKLLLFSILMNNIPGSYANARKKIELFLKNLRNKY